MSEYIEVRLLLVRHPGDTEPTVIGCVDRSIWDHWTERDESEWRLTADRAFGCDPRYYEHAEVWARFAPDDLVYAFDAPLVDGFMASGG